MMNPGANTANASWDSINLSPHESPLFGNLASNMAEPSATGFARLKKTPPNGFLSLGGRPNKSKSATSHDSIFNSSFLHDGRDMDNKPKINMNPFALVRRVVSKEPGTGSGEKHTPSEKQGNGMLLVDFNGQVPQEAKCTSCPADSVTRAPMLGAFWAREMMGSHNKKKSNDVAALRNLYVGNQSISSKREKGRAAVGSSLLCYRSEEDIRKMLLERLRAKKKAEFEKHLAMNSLLDEGGMKFQSDCEIFTQSPSSTDCLQEGSDIMMRKVRSAVSLVNLNTTTKGCTANAKRHRRKSDSEIGVHKPISILKEGRYSRRRTDDKREDIVAKCGLTRPKSRQTSTEHEVVGASGSGVHNKGRSEEKDNLQRAKQRHNSTPEMLSKTFDEKGSGMTMRRSKSGVRFGAPTTYHVEKYPL